MSSAGLQVFGDHGFVQIDQNYVNMAIMTKGWVTSSLQQVAQSNGVDPAPTAYLATVSYTGNSPVICIDTKGQLVSFYYTLQSGSNFTFCFLTFDSAGNSTPLSFTYYIFDLMPNLQATNQGLTVWNPAGRVTFNSDYEPMKMINTAQVPDSWNIVNGAAGTFPTYHPPASTTLVSSSINQKIAVGICLPKIYSYTLHQGSYQQNFQTFLTNNNNNPCYATTEGDSGTATPYGNAFGNGFNLTQPYGSPMFIVDVTNQYI